MENPTCTNCKFWISFKGSKSKGQCRRYSPSVITSISGGFTFIESSTITKFPETEFDDWCGEFEREKEGGSNE